MSDDPSKHYTQSICRWPEEDRPRERLLKYGEHRLSSSELLAILLGSGTQGQDALSLARTILRKFKTFRRMSHTNQEQWQEFKGLGPAKLAQIRAALEIGRRFREEEVLEERVKVKSSKDVAEMMMPRLRDLKIEVFKTILLDGQNRIIHIEEEAQGTVNYAAPIIREICQKALRQFAVSIICLHNHPSGDPRPSQEDCLFTNKLKEATQIMNIRFVDHIIIGDNRYYSFADHGKLG